MINKQDAPYENQEDDSFKLEEFGYILLAHWHWIILSVAIALGIAVLKILRTTPTYVQSTSLLIKSDDGKGGSSPINGLSQDFQNLGILASSTNINNEILTISAPVMMQEAVKRLHLELQMQVKNGLHTVPLYDNSPISLLMPQANDDFMCSFKMRLNANQTAELWDFETINGLNEKHITIKMGEIARTPVGIIVLQATKYWKRNFTSDEIYVTKYPVKDIGNMYNSRLSVALSNKESTILDISIVDESKQRASNLLYKLIEVYNEQWLKDRNRVAESTFEFITQRLNTLSKELGDVDQKISDYKSQAMLPDMDAASSMYLTQSTKNNDQILTLRNQLSVARYIREYLADRSKYGQYLPTNTGVGSTGIESMIANYNKTVSARNEVLDNSSENTPLVQKFNNELKLQRQTIMHSLDNFIAQIQSQVGNWENTEAQTNEKLAAAPQQVKKLLSVGRQQKVKEALYIYLLQKREENELSKTYTAWNTRIIQPPTGSDAPSSPRKNIILLAALAIGIFIPAGLLFLRETLNHTVRGRADLEDMQTPLISEIPEMVNKKHWWQFKKKDVRRQVYVKSNSRDLINESFRILRTKLDYFLKSTGESNKVIMLTSFNVGSGKSFISINLAKALSLKGAKVLAIDFDLRHASLSNFAKHTDVGITSYLSNITDNIDECIQHDAVGRGLDILPIGIIPPNPSELLLSDKMKPMFDKLREEYDYIILDCPPIEIVADASIVKDCADVTLFIVRAGVMDRRILKDVEELYENKVYKHMALILNGAPYISGRYGNYRYGYGYGYGKGYGYYNTNATNTI